jgi:hypothetical protein
MCLAQDARRPSAVKPVLAIPPNSKVVPTVSAKPSKKKAVSAKCSHKAKSVPTSDSKPSGSKGLAIDVSLTVSKAPADYPLSFAQVPTGGIIFLSSQKSKSPSESSFSLAVNPRPFDVLSLDWGDQMWLEQVKSLSWEEDECKSACDSNGYETPPVWSPKASPPPTPRKERPTIDLVLVSPIPDALFLPNLCSYL